MTSAKLAIGKRVKRRILTDGPISANDLETPPAISINAEITIEYVSGPVQITARRPRFAVRCDRRYDSRFRGGHAQRTGGRDHQPAHGSHDGNRFLRRKRNARTRRRCARIRAGTGTQIERMRTLNFLETRSSPMLKKFTTRRNLILGGFALYTLTASAWVARSQSLFPVQEANRQVPQQQRRRFAVFRCQGQRRGRYSEHHDSEKARPRSPPPRPKRPDLRRYAQRVRRHGTVCAVSQRLLP